MTRFIRVLSLALTFVMALSIGLPAVAASALQQEATTRVVTANAPITKKSTENLNLRQSASTSSAVLVLIPKATTLSVLQSKTGWDQVKYQGKTGWVSAQYLTVVKTQSNTQTSPASYRYLTSFQVLRSKASGSSTRLADVQRKSKVQYLGATGSWARVKVAGKTGFVPKNQLANKIPAPSYRYLTANTSVFKTSSTSSTKLLSVKRGSAVEWLRTSGGWAYVSVSGKSGWIQTKYLTTKKPVVDKVIGSRWTSSTVVVRAANNSSSKSLGSIKAGEKLSLYQVQGSWSKVKTSKGIGWIPTANLVTTAYTPYASVARWVKAQTTQRVSNFGSSKSQGSVAKSAQVTVYGVANGWAHVKSSKGTGWIPTKDLTTTKPVVDTVKGYRWPFQSTTVRATATHTAKSLGNIPAGEKVALYATSGSWSKIKSSKGTGWVPTSSLLTTAYVPLSNAKLWTSANVNLRSGNSVVFASKGVISKNQQVTALGTSNGWTRVTTALGTGWISSDYLVKNQIKAPVPETKPQAVYRWATANVNLRTGAGVVFKSLGVVPLGEKVAYLKSSNGWANVVTSKGTGWISEDYLRAQATTSLQPDAHRVINAVDVRFGNIISAIHTMRSGSVGHSSGKAVDLMIKNYKTQDSITKGNQLSNFLLDNREQLGIYYIIWRDKIWLPGSGWNEYSTSGKYGNQFSGNWNDTTKHNDHIHVEVYGNSGTGGKLDLSALSQ